jgi:hypothetical protein
MKAITIHQPWASLIAIGAKKIETRGWHTHYRGKIAIHAGLKVNTRAAESIVIAETLYKAGASFLPRDLSVGAIIATADLIDCVKMIDFNYKGQVPIECILENNLIVTGNEFAFGYYAIGRYAWLLDNIQPIPPIPAKGQQGLWNWAGKF